MSDSKIDQFVELTGADADTAKSMLEASKGDMDAALALHFEAGNDEDAPMPSAEDTESPPPPPPELPKETEKDLVNGILAGARQEGEPAASSFQGR